MYIVVNKSYMFGRSLPKFCISFHQKDINKVAFSAIPCLGHLFQKMLKILPNDIFDPKSFMLCRTPLILFYSIPYQVQFCSFYTQKTSRLLYLVPGTPSITFTQSCMCIADLHCDTSSIPDSPFLHPQCMS